MTLKQLERNTKNMVAAQQSQFFMSKYEKSKMNSTWNYSKFSAFNKSQFNQTK